VTAFFAIPDRWEIPDYVWQQSFDDMAGDGRLQREGVALWLGDADDHVARVTQVVLLRGPGVIKRIDQLIISAEVMNNVADAALARDLILVGQIHSHHPLASTDLSYPDRHMGITSPGYLSLVAPDFAQRENRQIEDCGVHVHEGEGGWRRLPVGEIARRFEMSARPPLAPLILGQDE
jgi:proteasome lid subunit RPN8/RPN11